VEIETIARRLGFDVIDPGSMSLEEQIAAFSQAGTVVGLHGAGLTNILFRGRRPMKLLEIMPPYRIPLCFYAIARKYGFAYDYIVGSGAPSNKLGLKYSYWLDPTSFESKLKGFDA